MLKFKDNRFNLKIELLGAFTTFFTAAYIIFVNPDILSVTGMDRQALIVVTCLVSAFGTIALGLCANVPFMMAPGMGLNAFFAYTLVLGKNVPWQTALGVVFLSGLLFLVLTLFGVREKIVKSIPATMRIGISVGIGLFIAFIGFKNMGLVVANKATFVSLGSINGHVLIGLAGLFLIVLFEILKIKGAIFIGIIFSTILAVISGNVMLPDKFLSLPPSISPIAFQLNIIDACRISLFASVFSFMYVDLFDSLGTIIAVSSQAGFINKDNTIPNIGKMLTIDALATMFGAFMGTSTTTTYIESASGVAVGARTGLSSVFTGILFLIAIFFVPLISIVPSYATAPALIIVGIYMIKDIKNIDFSQLEEAVPAFLTFLLIPLTYSINTGIMFGFISFVLIKLILGKFKDINILLIIIAFMSVINLIVS